ncbi:MAG: methyl-accepting chemotaxis protein [Deltaproteobacteria bacterium]|nr:methyl-accepting chemotaxis protein [Deltaproteobacteria bacterium]
MSILNFINIKNLRIGKRLLAGFGIMCVLLVGLTLAARVGVNRLLVVMDDSQRIADKVACALVMADGLNKLYTTQGADILCVNSAERDANNVKMVKYRELASAKLGELKQTVKTDQDKQMHLQLEETLTKIQEENRQAMEMAQDFQGGDGLRVYNEQFGSSLVKLDQVLESYTNYVHQRLETTRQAAVAATFWVHAILISACLIGLTLASLFGLVITRSITKPLKEGINLLNAIADGDLSREVPPELQSQRDEIGELARAMGKMSLSLRDIVTRIGREVTKLSAASTELSGASQGMASGAEELTTQASTATAATEEISANLNVVSTTSETMGGQSRDVAHSAEEISTNVNSIAAAVEEMSASIQEVSRNCAQAQQMAENASDASNDAREKMTLLDQAARDIGKVIDVITEITEQTKLLALNATIEAARAGDAGKGFAVVASEVKELAKQTADATGKIASQIRDMQGRTTGVVNDIQRVTEINKKVHEYTYTIAAAVEEQTATTGEISRTIAGVAQRTSEVSNLSRGFSVAIEQKLVSAIREAATGVDEVSRNIHGVNDVAQGSARSASGINVSSNELAQLANELQTQVDKFKTR